MTATSLAYQAILFDFDYTLADSSEGIIQCVNHALQAMGLPPAGHDEIRATIGLSLTEIFMRLGRPAHPERGPEFSRLFAQRADEIMAGCTRVYPAVSGMLQALRPSGVRLGILSTKFRYRIEAILQREGLLDAFELVVGGEDVQMHKPDPEGLLLALAKLGCRPAQLLYVGDSAADAQASQRARVPFIAVLSGVTPLATLGQYPNEAILNDVSCLPRWLERHAASSLPSGENPHRVREGPPA